MREGTLADLDDDVRRRLESLPPTAALVYLELRNGQQPRTLKQLAYDTMRPRSTVHSALRQLHEADLVSCSPRYHNPPTSEWKVAE